MIKMPRIVPCRLWILLALGVAIASGCVRQRDHEKRVLILQEGAPQDRLRLAQEYVTPEHANLLLASIPKRFPQVGAGDISMDLRWQQFVSTKGNEVSVYIELMPTRDGIDASAIADYVGEQMEAQVHAYVASHSTK